MIDFAATVPADNTFRWEGVYEMTRDHRAIIMTIRDIITATNVTSAIAIADRAVCVVVMPPSPHPRCRTTLPRHCTAPHTLAP